MLLTPGEVQQRVGGLGFGGTQAVIVGLLHLGLAGTRAREDAGRRRPQHGRRAARRPARVASVDLDVVFQRGCAASKDQEVTRQRPATGTRLDTYEGRDVPVRLDVCVAERDFLADCDLKDLRNDLRSLPRRLDADLVLAVVEGFLRCKVGYDVKLSKAVEARTALAAQQAKRGGKAQIRTAIEIPTPGPWSPPGTRTDSIRRSTTGRTSSSPG
jgi:hypothetical protein